MNLAPRAIRIEATSHCQLRCPTCPTAEGRIDEVIGRGHLSSAMFRVLLQKNPEIKMVELSNFGEMFLNPELQKIIQIAFESGVELRSDNGANFNFATDEVIESLVKYQFKSLCCSIDGATNDTYIQYRRQGSLDRVLDNIRKLNATKEAQSSIFPRLTWQFVIFEHNRHEIEMARALAKSLRMHFRLKLNWGNYSQIQLETPTNQLTPLKVISRAEFKEQFGRTYLNLGCMQLWNAPQFNWNGELLGCCRNFWRSFDSNVFEIGLKGAMNSEKIAYARQMLTGAQVSREDIPCTQCSVYRHMEKTKTWLNIQIGDGAD